MIRRCNSRSAPLALDLDLALPLDLDWVKQDQEQEQEADLDLRLFSEECPVQIAMLSPLRPAGPGRLRRGHR